MLVKLDACNELLGFLCINKAYLGKGALWHDLDGKSNEILAICLAVLQVPFEY